MEIILLVIIAVTLSMDAFSLSLAYGTIGLDKKNIILLSCIVGIYHFIMPQIGNLFGILILKIIKMLDEKINDKVLNEIIIKFRPNYIWVDKNRSDFIHNKKVVYKMNL